MERILSFFLAIVLLLSSPAQSLAGHLGKAMEDNRPEKAEEAEQTEFKEVEFPTGLLENQAIEIDVENEDILTQVCPMFSTVSPLSEQYTYAWDAYSTNYFYNLSTEEEKELLWEALDEMCKGYLGTVADAVTLEYEKNTYYHTGFMDVEGWTTEEIHEFVQIFRTNNPQYYFLNNMFWYGETETSVTFSLGIYDAFADGEDRADATYELGNQVDAWKEELSDCRTEEEKLYEIHSLICEKVDYNYGFYEEDFDEEAAFSQSAYSVFCMDTTVCAGYSEAMALMCNAVGIDALCVTSYNHQWNKVRIEDQWYNVDATWADGDDGIYYDYYLRNDAFYDDTNNQSESHEEEVFWEEYLPICELDSNPDNYSEPGTLPVISQTVISPTFNVTEADGGYNVEILCDTEGATIYYTLDGTEPSVAFTKSMKYANEAFFMEERSTLKAIAIKGSYYDSAIATYEEDNLEPQAPNAPQVELVSTNPMTLSWEAVEGAIGYRVYRAEVNTEPDVEEGNDEENQEEGMEEPQESQEGDEEPQEPQEEYVLLTSLTEETTYTDTTAEYQKEYKYYVTAYILDEEEMLESDAGNIVSGMKDVPVVSDFEVNDLNHGEITLTWEMDEHAVLDGYLIYALIATENEGEVEGENNEPQRVLIADITNITISAYGHDVSTYEAGTKITYQVCPYVIVDDTKLESLTAPIERAAVVRKEALEADVQWYVQATIDNDYLVVEIEGDVETDYCIYITDEDGDTITEVIRDISYTEAESGVQLISLERPFDQKCYFYIVDADELCGIQEEPFCAGGVFVEPQLENVPNVMLETLDESHILQAEITNPMSGFKYTYQWYVKDSIDGSATPIEGANASTYEASITSEYEVKYYYCVVSCVFRVKMEYSTRSANDLPTYVCGPSVGTNIVVAPIEELTYSGSALEPEVVLTEGDRTLIKDEDYLISYNNNVNAGQEAEVIITFINAYAHAEAKNVYFTIEPYSASNLTYEAIEDQIYTGEPIEPEIVVKHGDVILQRGVDYTVDYRSNTSPGTARAYLRFKGNYSGTKNLYFEIIKPIPSHLTSENHTVDEATGYISKITAGTTVAAFKGAINERDYVAIFKEDTVVAEDALLGTGMSVNIMDGEEVKKNYTIIVTGDTNGDGKINITDMIAVKASTLKKSNLTGAYEKAADVNGDGKINITDFIKVKAAILGKDTIVGVSVAE